MPADILIKEQNCQKTQLQEFLQPGTGMNFKLRFKGWE
jgi:hypothetical protein